MIKSALVCAGGVLLAPVVKLYASASNQLSKLKQKRVFIFQDRAHFDVEGKVEEYQAPTSMVSTKQYLDTVDQEEFLKRHWFV